jgi:hypothetical protein
MNTSYIYKTDHRNGSPAKSQWTISTDQERHCFDVSSRFGWLDQNGQWGLHLLDGLPSALGKTAKHTGRQIDVKICRFITDLALRSHGYPADYRKNSHDTPAFETLAKWHASGFIAKHEIAKLLKGKPCRLSG